MRFHELNRSVEEGLYSAMEDFALNIIIGKGPAARCSSNGYRKIHVDRSYDEGWKPFAH